MYYLHNSNVYLISYYLNWNFVNFIYTICLKHVTIDNVWNTKSICLFELNHVY